MAISSIQLEAFAVLSQTLHFSRAAKILHITQSSLSQRIKNLESDLGIPLLIRGRQGVQLTEDGRRVLRYARLTGLFEEELLGSIKAKPSQGLSGTLRVAAYSTTLRSVVLPSLAGLIRAHPRVQLEFQERELRELTSVLLRSESDFILLDREWKRAGIECVELGREDYVLIESTRYESRNDVFLDHDPEDQTTEDFLRLQKKTIAKPGSIRRNYLDQIEGIIEGVALGFGRAVVPRHLVEGARGVRVVTGLIPLRVPVVLHFFKQPFYTALQDAVRKELIQNARKALA